MFHRSVKSHLAQRVPDFAMADFRTVLKMKAIEALMSFFRASCRKMLEGFSRLFL